METDISPRPALHPLLFVGLLLLTLLIGFVVIGPLVGFLISLPFYPGSGLDMAEALANPMADEAMKIPMYIMQGFASLIGLIVGPMLLLYVLRRSSREVFASSNHQPAGYLLTLAVVIVFMGVNSWFVEQNANAHFPSFMKGIEEWAREKEDLAAALTKYMTEFNTTGDLIIAFIVIAVLPAIGEEFVFRGLLQTELQKLTRNPHLAIVLSAILFSAIHMQFFGFIPRFLLGVLFGYLYFWSGNLSVSILAHFVNNGTAVIGMYLYQQGAVQFDMESTEALPAVSVVTSAVLTMALLYFFYRIYHQASNTRHA